MTFELAEPYVHRCSEQIPTAPAEPSGTGSLAPKSEIVMVAFPIPPVS